MAAPLRLHHPSQGKTAGHSLHRRVLQPPAPALSARLPTAPGSTQREPFIPSSRIGSTPIRRLSRITVAPHSRSGFYEWRSRPMSATAERRERLKVLIAVV